jgi:predicted RNA binding protein YcfA (HicA-like mRNA interferase family)
MKPKELVKKLETDGWKIIRISGSHYIMKHFEKPGMPVIPLHNKDLKPGTLNNILKQAGIK